MTIRGNSCSKMYIARSPLGQRSDSEQDSCRLKTTFFSSVATRPSSNKFDLALAAPSVRVIRVHIVIRAQPSYRYRYQPSLIFSYIFCQSAWAIKNIVLLLHPQGITFASGLVTMSFSPCLQGIAQTSLVSALASLRG